jgi:hypothetical protein
MLAMTVLSAAITGLSQELSSGSRGTKWVEIPTITPAQNAAKAVRRFI